MSITACNKRENSPQSVYDIRLTFSPRDAMRKRGLRCRPVVFVSFYAHDNIVHCIVSYRIVIKLFFILINRLDALIFFISQIQTPPMSFVVLLYLAIFLAVSYMTRMTDIISLKMIFSNSITAYAQS